MFGRRLFLVVILSAALIIVSISMFESHSASGQVGSSGSTVDNERDRGIELYEKGDTVGAVKALQAFVKKQKNDIRAWHYLGLALSRNGKTNDARKAHEKAAKIGKQLIDISVNGMRAPNELFARIAPIKRELVEAADSADKYLELSSKPSRSKISEWRGRAEHLRDFAELIDELRGERVYLPAEVTTKARILSKLSPQYSEEARKNQVTGTVVILMVLSAKGNVKIIAPIESLPYGLTEEALKVARTITFVPAIKDGKPVSQFMKVEYNFNIY